MTNGRRGPGAARTATHYDSLFTALALDTLLPTKQESEAGIAQWFQRRTRDRKVPGSSPSRSGWRIFLLQGQLCVLTYFGICSTLVLLQYHVKDPDHSAKSAGGRLQLNAHIPYLCGFE